MLHALGRYTALTATAATAITAGLLTAMLLSVSIGQAVMTPAPAHADTIIVDHR